MSEVGTITVDEARALVADQTLWPLVRDFLWDFAPSIHKSWREGLKVEGSQVEGSQVEGLKVEGLPPSALSSPRVKAWLLARLGVEPCFHVFPKDDWSRLLLLDGETLLGIASWLGALACADSLRRVTGGSEVRGLKAALPGVYPEVFGYTAYFSRLKVEGFQIEGPETVVGIGLSMILSLLAGLSDSLRRRLLLKLPKGLLPSSLPQFTLSPSNLQLLLKLRFPEAYKLCCS